MSIPGATQEPRLLIQARPGFWTPRFAGFFGSTVGLAAVGLVLLVLSGNLFLPFAGVVHLEGKTGSKGEIFDDPQMQRLLMSKHISVHITRTGSREVAIHDYAGYDFVFPSGKPAAKMVRDRLAADNKSPQTRAPFTSPLVLATFREYAETLVAAGVATVQTVGPGNPALYYTLDTDKFLRLIEHGRTWDELGISRQKTSGGQTITNGNRVLAHSPSMCDSNSGEAFVALAAFVRTGLNAPPTAANVSAVVNRIKPLLTMQGMYDADLFASYITPEGSGKAPIVVVYEHQYLAYQIRHVEAAGAPDADRVLLYPKEEMLTDPEYIPLDGKAEALGRILVTDPKVRRRLMELGYRVLDPTNATTSDQLWRYLADHHIPAPDRGGSGTKAELPQLPILEQMISAIGGCP